MKRNPRNLFPQTWLEWLVIAFILALLTLMNTSSHRFDSF